MVRSPCKVRPWAWHNIARFDIEFWTPFSLHKSPAEREFGKVTEKLEALQK